MASNDLIQQVYAFFLNAYHQGAAGAAGAEILGFEPMGFAPGCVSAGANIAAAALQEISQLANALPQLDGGVVTRTLRTLAGQYSVILDAAKPASADFIATVSSLQSQASKLYHDAESDGELDGPKATFATPADWFDLNNTANWTSFSYDSTVQVTAPPPPTPSAPKVHLTWHVVPQPMRAMIFQEVEQPHPFAFQAAVPGLEAQHPVATTAAVRPIARIAPLIGRESFAAPSERFQPHALQPAAGPAAAPARRLFRADFSRAAVTRLAAQTTPQPVETKTFQLSFDYCLVRLRRPWLSGDFLSAAGWHVPGQHRGDFASGAPANSGPLAAIPTAFIAIKKLVISGAWSANDVAVAGNSAAFGPFSLGEVSAAAQTSVSNPGVQIIAWVCDMQPCLPPNDDPSLAQGQATTPPS